MDQDLIEYLDRRFKQSRRETRRGFEETNRRLGDFRREVDVRFEETREETRQGFEAMNGRFENLEVRVDRLEEQGRHTHVVIEDLRSKIETVAEAVAGLQQRQDQFQEEVSGLADAPRLFAAAYGSLDRRISALESG